MANPTFCLLRVFAEDECHDDPESEAGESDLISVTADPHTDGQTYEPATLETIDNGESHRSL